MQKKARIAVYAVGFLIAPLLLVASAQPDDVHVQRGMQAMLARDRRTAIQEFTTALAIYPKDAFLLKMLVSLYLTEFESKGKERSQGLDSAEKYMERLLTVAPKDPEALDMAAIIHAHRGEYAKSEVIYLGLFNRSDVSGDLRSRLIGNLGEVYLDWGKYDLAERRLKEAVDSTHQPIPVLNIDRNLGRLYELTGRKQEAARIYQLAITFAEGTQGDPLSYIDEFQTKLNKLGAVETGSGVGN